MFDTQMVMYEEEFNRSRRRDPAPGSGRERQGRLHRRQERPAHRRGRRRRDIDTTSLASLTAGNIAATGGIAKLLGEEEFPTQFHEGERDNIHIKLVGNRVILVVIFDAGARASGSCACA